MVWRDGWVEGKVCVKKALIDMMRDEGAAVSKIFGVDIIYYCFATRN